MSEIRFTALILFMISIQTMMGQITPELQKAINSVPFAKFDYPANRDRSMPPQVASPQAFAFAYYNLPYAINLDMMRNELTNGYIGIVLVDYNSIKLPAETELDSLTNNIIELQGLLNQQFTAAHIYGFYPHTNFSRSMLSHFETEGDAIIALREILSTRALIESLTSRLSALKK